MITVTIDDAELRRALRRLQSHVENLRPVMQDIGEALTASTKARFAASKAPDGSPWAPLSETTLRRYEDERIARAVSSARARAARQEGATDATIYRAGAKAEERATKRASAAPSRRPLIGESKRLSREIHYRATPLSVEIGSSLIYSAVHQYGAKARSFTGGRTPWGDIPARGFIGLSDQDRTDFDTIIAEHFRI